MVATNLTAPFALMRAFLADMKSRGTGHVITSAKVELTLGFFGTHAEGS